MDQPQPQPHPQPTTKDSPFTDALNSFNQSDQPGSNSDTNESTTESSTITVISEHTPDSPSSPSSSGLRHRRITSPHNLTSLSQSQFFKNNPDGLFDLHPPLKKTRPLSLNNSLNNNINKNNSNEKLNENLHEKLNEKLDENLNGSNGSVSGSGNGNVDSRNNGSGSELVYLLAELAIKVIGFQAKFLTSSFAFPLWVLHSVFLLVTDPFGVIKVGRSYVLGDSNGSGVIGICYSCVKLFNHLWYENRESTLRLCVRMGWGLLWFVYCGGILVSLLVPALVFGGVMVRWVVEEPVQVTEKLVFDYTKDTPMAFVPLVSCRESSVVVHDEKSVIGSLVESRTIPFDREVLATVSLTLPESDYNTNLGVFQVRVDYLSNDGIVLGSIRQPCMLHFKSQPVRLVSTFFKLVSLLTGYSSETQTLDISFRGYTEKDVHTSCSRVVIEQRAEFARRGGVPEIYSASLKIESQLPFVRRMLWYSKWLIYIWISGMMYIMELFLTLLCCRPIIFPWVRSEDGTGSLDDIASHNKPSELS